MSDSKEENKIAEIEKNVQKFDSAFTNIASFDNAQRMAKALSMSSLVPAPYQNNIPNVMVALEMATRVGISPIFVMQSLDIIKGKPSWNSSFIISALNSCGRFKPMKFRFDGEEKTLDYGCTAWTYDVETGEVVEGVKITWGMVKAEGWLDKKGSKWKTMPKLMFHYRSASFFGRVHAPDILNGMHTAEEQIDIHANENKMENIHEDLFVQLTELWNNNDFVVTEDELMNIERIIEQKEVLSYQKAINFLTSKIKTNE